VTEVQTKNLTASVAELTDKLGCNSKDIETKLSVRLNPDNGAPEITQGTVSCEVDEDAKKDGVVDGVKNLFGFGSKKPAQEPLKEDDRSSGSSSSSTTGKADASSSKKGSKTKSSAAADKSAEPLKPAKKNVKVYLGFETEPRGLPQVSAAEMKRMKTR
jgi:hypoxia up-regulated 1